MHINNITNTYAILNLNILEQLTSHKPYCLAKKIVTENQMEIYPCLKIKQHNFTQSVNLRRYLKWRKMKSKYPNGSTMQNSDERNVHKNKFLFKK